MLTLLLAAAAVPAGAAFPCTPTRVWDGDGPLWCAEGPRLRLAAIAAREHDETCRRNQPCPQASGRAARDALVMLLGGARGITREGHVRVSGPRLRCRSGGPDRYGRTVATCDLPGGRDLADALVATGTVLRWQRYEPTRPRV